MRNKVGDLGFVSEGPQQAVRGRVGLSFFTDLCDPLVTFCITNAVLRGVAARFLFDKTYFAGIGLHLIAARAEKQVTALEVGRLFPHYRLAR